MRAGGAVNHRGNLSDWVMFKDNHLAVLGIAEAVASAKATWPGRLVHVEATDLEQLAQALEAGADAVLLDNMTPEEAKAAVDLVDDWVASQGRRPPAARVQRRDHGRDGRRLRGAGRRPAQLQPDHPVGPRARHRPRHPLTFWFDPPAARLVASDAVLLALDVGNTQTVVGLYDLDPRRRQRRPPARRHRRWSTTGASPPTWSAPPTSTPSCSRSSSASTASPGTTTTSRASRCARRCPASPARCGACRSATSASRRWSSSPA